MPSTIPCRKCGALFAASRAGVTVRCLACRGRKAPAAAKAAGPVACVCGKTVAPAKCPRFCHLPVAERPAVRVL